MSDALWKLRPDRDLQCYFRRPSAIAALSEATESQYTLSGCWREQFDWAVVEWNRDNVIEHPILRNLPDGDLRGLRLTYLDERQGCIPLDSDLYPTVDWPYLRVWANNGGEEQVYRVSLKEHAIPISGSFVPARVEFELGGTPITGQYVGLAWLGEHHTYPVGGMDDTVSILEALVSSVNAFSPWMWAERQGERIVVRYRGLGHILQDSQTGTNGNRLGAYSFSTGEDGVHWDAAWRPFAGGESPTTWRVNLDFSALVDVSGRPVPTQNCRKLRWTYAADLQGGSFSRTEFAVAIREWQVTGTNRVYVVAGPGSRRIESDGPEVTFQGNWGRGTGNFSGGSIRYTSTPGDSAVLRFTNVREQQLFLGTRAAESASVADVRIDGGAARSYDLRLAGEDVLIRVPVCSLPAGAHTVAVTHAGNAGTYLYFDFLELASSQSTLPTSPIKPTLTLATDWDTDHSLAIPAERTAWLIQQLGYHGRVNHYVGALWFYELSNPEGHWASATVRFEGVPQANSIVTLLLSRSGEADETAIAHLTLIGDSPESIARAFAIELNRGYTSIRAEADGPVLTIIARALGVIGNKLRVRATPVGGPFRVVIEAGQFEGGADGRWLTDLLAVPKLNRAVRDWSRAFYAALARHATPVTAAFSMELQHGDPTPEAGIAQRYPSGQAVVLNTPAIQTNFGTQSTAFWSGIYREMAQLMRDGGVTPYLQFGEVQWWYFPYDGSGLPFYDAETVSDFASHFGRAPAVITTPLVNPNSHVDEANFLRDRIGQFTDAVMTAVRAQVPECVFEVLYPTDVNAAPFTGHVNFANLQWTADRLANLKTESFTYTLGRDLDAGFRTIEFPVTQGFPVNQASHLVGISDANTAWQTEAWHAQTQQRESVVLFALDQFCLVGYSTAPLTSGRRSVLQGLPGA